MVDAKYRIPETGIGKQELLDEMTRMREQDANWRAGRTASLVYYAGEEHTDLLKQAYMMFFCENGLNPMAFPSLKDMENQVIAMVAGMLAGDERTVGTMTTGGTESIFMAMKAYRHWARAHRPEVTRPEILLPITAHPAFEKAAHYLDLTNVHYDIRDDYRADPAKARELFSDNTIAVVGSAVAYPHGVVDPIEELAAFAQEKGVGFHVDACLGGFMLPWLKKMGLPIPAFDFSVSGVTSISADLHKYGYAAKGASTVLYRDVDWRRHQFFAYSAWPGGIYASPSMTGTRAGGAIAAAWAALRGMGESGYLKNAKIALDATRAMIDGINAIDGLYVMGEPDMTVFAFTSATLDPFAIGDAMERRGWDLDRQQLPNALHMMVTAAHEYVVEPFLAALRESVAEVAANPVASSEGTAAMYGMMASIPDKAQVNEFAVDFIDGLFTPPRS